MNVENKPAFVAGEMVDAAILRGEAVDCTHHCTECGVFGWDWVWGTCPSCGRHAAEKLVTEG